MHAGDCQPSLGMFSSCCLQAARAKVEAASIPGTRLAFRKLGFAGKPYLMDRDTPTNRAVATVSILPP